MPNKGFCNLVEINVSRYIGDTAGLHRAAHILARANYRQTVVDYRGDGVLQEAWTLNNNNLHLCGVGVTGVAYREDMQEYDWKQLKYAAVFGTKSIADELGLPHSANITVVKPSGTVSKIMDTTEGVHRPLAKFIFNWINFSNNDPLVAALIAANYRTLPNPGDVTSTLVCVPIKYEGIPFTKKSVTRKDGTVDDLEVNTETALEQLERYKKLQLYYCEQNVSNTISYDPSEVEGIVDWLLTNWDIYVGVSFLFRSDPTLSAKDLGYEYLPQETVTEKRYTEYFETLSKVIYDNTDSFEELDEDECATGACPIK